MIVASPDGQIARSPPPRPPPVSPAASWVLPGGAGYPRTGSQPAGRALSGYPGLAGSPPSLGGALLQVMDFLWPPGGAGNARKPARAAEELACFPTGSRRRGGKGVGPWFALSRGFCLTGGPSWRYDDPSSGQPPPLESECRQQPPQPSGPSPAPLLPPPHAFCPGGLSIDPSR